MEETVNPAPSTRDVGMRYGLIMGVISIVYFLVLALASVDMTSGIGRWSSFVFLIAVIVLAHKYFKDEGDSFMSYGQGLGIVFWLSLVSSVMYNAFFYIYIKYIDSTFVQQIMDKQMEQMQQRGLSDEQVEQAMSMTAKFTTPEMMLVFGLIGGIVMYMICGVIITIFTQKKNPAADI